LGLEFATNDYISKVLPERMDSGAPTL
jgi:hypothetical protein